MKFPLLALTGLLALTATSALAAKKKKSPEAAPTPALTAPAAAAPTKPSSQVTPLRPGEFTTYFCTIWHEVTFDSSAAPKLAPVGYVPVPHMGNISLFRETGVKVPRPVDLWDEDEHEHGEHGDHELVRAPLDTAHKAAADTAAFVLQWADLKGGQVKYEYMNIREDHKGPIKPFFAGMGGNLYIGTCDMDLGE